MAAVPHCTARHVREGSAGAGAGPTAFGAAACPGSKRSASQGTHPVSATGASVAAHAAVTPTASTPPVLTDGPTAQPAATRNSGTAAKGAVAVVAAGAAALEDQGFEVLTWRVAPTYPTATSPAAVAFPLAHADASAPSGANAAPLVIVVWPGGSTVGTAKASGVPTMARPHLPATTRPTTPALARLVVVYATPPGLAATTAPPASRRGSASVRVGRVASGVGRTSAPGILRCCQRHPGMAAATVASTAPITATGPAPATSVAARPANETTGAPQARTFTSTLAETGAKKRATARRAPPGNREGREPQPKDRHQEPELLRCRVDAPCEREPPSPCWPDEVCLQPRRGPLVAQMRPPPLA